MSAEAFLPGSNAAHREGWTIFAHMGYLVYIPCSVDLTGYRLQLVRPPPITSLTSRIRAWLPVPEMVQSGIAQDAHQGCAQQDLSTNDLASRGTALFTRPGIALCIRTRPSGEYLKATAGRHGAIALDPFSSSAATMMGPTLSKPSIFPNAQMCRL
ncbi:hypothetical protein PYCCODRAFT_1046284 [Trametes coccinea BRFM310]|uniref:Uncharacterized protein n=1 Tax=Trametes coccinea (strain BRFM310) TaxID=1353009 RepID=A0A1Y2IA02_TRAC3|nr:hypothetical protein PYCCODRAFT_1046284 [Trametes coccinea BRFM310]